ncbi:MAG TPA: TetR/AcrR family transcriptional regulator [Opitutaceae bacterium]|jgi:AcrR family transcriptional regulator
MDTQSAILQVARRAFDRRGLAGLSLRAIAAKVGITPMAIYRHFKNKEALVDALVHDAMGEWTARVEALPPAEGREKLTQLTDAFLEFALVEPRRFEAAFLVPSRKARRYPDDFLSGFSTSGNVQRQAIEHEIRRGAFAEAEPVELMIINAALAQGLVSLYRAARIAGGEKDFRALFRRAMARLISSYGKGGSK